MQNQSSQNDTGENSEPFLPATRWSLSEWINHHQPSETTLLLITAILVGVGAGLGAVIFRWMINTITTVSFQGGRELLGFLGPYYVILIPAIGGLGVGPLIYFFAQEAKGHGVPEVMAAVALRGGRIRPVVSVIKALASSLCIGTGGAAGREGPIVQIGSSLGSSLGQILRFSDDRIRMLVACGSAGGIAATFNAPIAGVLFALEVILGEFTAGNFATVVISSVTASVISRSMLGNTPAFAVPPYHLHTVWELFLYIALGAIAALVGVGFTRTLYKLEDQFDALTFPEYLKPVLGGLLVGTIGVFAPEIFGVGYEAIEETLHNGLLWQSAGFLLLAKVAATSFTLGSGGSGGVFAPSLFMGAMLGASFGGLVHQLLPSITAEAGAYSLVAMAAVFAAAANAPITAVFILFEMTGNYQIILPLMLASVVAVLLARKLDPESIYTTKLARRGIHLESGRDIDVMQSVQVAEVIGPSVDTVPADMPIDELARRFQSLKRRAFPVLDKAGFLFGVVSLQDLDEAISAGTGTRADLTAGDIATRQVVSVSPDDSIDLALKRMGPRGLSTLPVVSRQDPRRLLGVIRADEIVRAYNLSVVRRKQVLLKIDRLLTTTDTPARFVEYDLASDSPAIGMSVSELAPPRGCVIVSIRRGKRILIPRGDTRLENGDSVTVFVEREHEQELRRLFFPTHSFPHLTGQKDPA